MKHFRSPKALGEHFTRLAAESRLLVDHLAGVGATIVAEQAKANLGHYQDAAPPFEAWAKLADSTIAAHNRLGVGESPLLVTGQLYASIESHSEGDKGIAGSTSPIMEYQEFGTSKIPPRSVLGLAAVQSRDSIRNEYGASVAAYLAAKGWKRPRFKLKESK